MPFGGEDILTSFGFTAQDHELAGGRRYVDPMDLGPVWTNLAKRIIAHLTAQTTRADVFELLISAVGLYDQYRDWLRGDAGLAFQTFYVTVEQAFAHGYRAAGADWPLPGRRAVGAWQGQPTGRRQGTQAGIADGGWICDRLPCNQGDLMERQRSPSLPEPSRRSPGDPLDTRQGR